MFGIAAVVLFAVALILHIAGDNKLIEDLVLGGFLALALHLLGLWPSPWRRP